MSDTVEATISLLTDHQFSTPLKRRFEGEFRDQPAYIYVSLNGCGNVLISAAYSGLVGGAYLPEEFYGFERQFQIPNTLRTHEINELIRSLTPLAARMGEGAFTWVDGMSNLHLKLDEDASAAAREIWLSIHRRFWCDFPEHGWCYECEMRGA